MSQAGQPTPTRPITRAEAARHLLRLRDASSSFMGYVKLMRSDWAAMPPFQVELIKTLDKLERGELKNAAGEPVHNVLITMPPRHSKSAVATELFPAYCIARNPARAIMSCSYNQELASDFGGKVRDYVTDPLTHQAFPYLEIDQSTRAKDFWKTTDRGQYAGVGIGGTTTGRPANILIIDDPVKSREEADSVTYRNKTWNYYTSALETRKQPLGDQPPITIVILTRWHPDDLAGRLMKSEDWAEGRWLHINFPAIRTIKTDVQVLRSALPKDHPHYLPGSQVRLLAPAKRYVKEEKEVALWPERFPLAELKRKQRLNPREFASLYQQSPYIEGGNIIKTDWWRYYPAKERPENFASLIIAVDTAFKKTETADYSVAIVAGLAHDGDIYILDLIRGRYDFPELKRVMVNLNTLWRGKGLRALYIEDKASGQSLIQELKSQSGITVIPYKVVNDKVARINSVTPMIEGGRVYLPDSAPWLDDFIQETVEFPSGTHDDQCDALSLALDVLSKVNLTPEAITLTFNPSNSLMARSKSLLARAGGAVFRGWGE